MDDKERQDLPGQETDGDGFNFEDIMKEFSGEEQPQEPDVRIWGSEEPVRPTAGVTPDTVRLDDISSVLKKEEKDQEFQTQRFTPVGGPEEEPPLIYAIPEETVEPYSEDWEPEYEQPIADYIPPQPIPFRPKSRLQELKRKLVEGPERRYYELAEQGLGKLQLAIFLNLLVTALAVGTAAMYALQAVPAERTRFVVFIQFFALLMSGLLGSYQLMEGFGDMIRGRFSLNTLLMFSFLACCADGILCLRQVRIPCCAAFSLSMTMSLWSAYQKRNTEMAQMDTMRKAIHLDSVVSSPEYFDGRPGFLRGEGWVEDFMDTYNQRSGGEKTLSVYALVALFVSLGSGITAGVLHSLHMGLQVFCASLLVAAPASAFVTLSRPAALLERRLHKQGTVICGWQGVKGLSRSGVFPMTDEDLFPGGCTKMNGVKFYGDRDPDEVVAYAAALIGAGGGGMVPLFDQLLASRNGKRFAVEEFRNYGNGGIGGVVNGEAVLAGTLSFMQNMSIDLPEGTRVNQAVYVAVDGFLSGVFAITYSKAKSSAVGLTTLCAYRGLTPVLVAGDFMLTEAFLKGKFGVNTRRIVFPSRSVREELAAKKADPEATALALTTKDGLAGAAYAVTGARALRSASIAGVTVHMMGGILGLLMILALAIVGADHLLMPSNILLYEFLWMIPGLLITEWTRSV